MKFESYYDQHWLSTDSYFQIHRQRFLQTWEVIKPICSGYSEGRVLDVGGVGPLTRYMQTEKGWSIFQSKTDLRKQIPFEDAFFDLIVCTETIEHIKDVASDQIEDLESFNYSGINVMLGEFKRVMKQGGRLLITTPNANSYITAYKWLVGETLLMDPKHVREFSLSDLRRVCEQTGFSVDKIYTIDSWSEDFGKGISLVKILMGGLSLGAGVERGDNIVGLFTNHAA